MSRPLRVILNDRPLCRTLTGVGNYIAQLLTHAPGEAPEVAIAPFYFTYLTRQDWRERHRAPDAPASTQAGGGYQPADMGESRQPWWVRRVLQGGYRGLFRTLARGYWLYHEPNHIPMRCGLPTVTTIHDLSVIAHPEWHPADRVKWYEREFDAGVRQTRIFLAASEFTKREMTSRLGIAANRIVVTYQAARPAFHPVAGDELVSRRAALGAPERFFLYVGTLEPRKNVGGLLEAYAALPSAVRRKHPLLIAGAWGWKQEQLRGAIARHGLGDDVRFLGYLFDEQLAALYSSCTALVWPTLYEGFGLPPLEALACGARAIVSNAASLPEVVGDAGKLLDPFEIPAWTAAMQEAAEVNSPERRARPGDASEVDTWSHAKRRAVEQASRFTWASFVRQTVGAYQAALAGA